MKLIRFVSIFIIVFLSVMSPSLSMVSYYKVDASIGDEGRTSVDLSIISDLGKKKFQFLVFGDVFNLRYKNFNYCKMRKGEITEINCFADLKNYTSLHIHYETDDFVRSLDEKKVFFADFSFHNETPTNTFVSIKLPVGYVLSSDLPEYVKTSDGKRIILLRSLDNQSTIIVKFFFEPVSGSIVHEMFEKYMIIILLVVIAAGVLVYVVYSKITREREKILSVLDKDERKVLEIIMNEKKIIQRKIVSMTNLSKSKVSRIIAKLKERGLIEVERRGRTNIIKKKKF